MKINSAWQMTREDAGSAPTRTVVFISKATPGDDEFTLWLAPRLEATGYTVFADIVTLEAGGLHAPAA